MKHAWQLTTCAVNLPEPYHNRLSALSEIAYGRWSREINSGTGLSMNDAHTWQRDLARGLSVKLSLSV